MRQLETVLNTIIEGVMVNAPTFKEKFAVLRTSAWRLEERTDSILEMLYHLGKQTGNHKKIVYYCKNIR